jgi:hypothetical protein
MHFFQLAKDTQFIILSLLPFPDLFSVAKSCKLSKNIVDEYLQYAKKQNAAYFDGSLQKLRLTNDKHWKIVTGILEHFFLMGVKTVYPKPISWQRYYEETKIRYVWGTQVDMRDSVDDHCHITTYSISNIFTTC